MTGASAQGGPRPGGPPPHIPPGANIGQSVGNYKKNYRQVRARQTLTRLRLLAAARLALACAGRAGSGRKLQLQLAMAVFVSADCERMLRVTNTPGGAGALTERGRGAAQTVCTYWLKGLCMKGDTCGFLHVFDVARMPVCRQLLKHGVCKEADCPYKHSLDDIKVAAPPLPGPALRPPCAGLCQPRWWWLSGTAVQHSPGARFLLQKHQEHTSSRSCGPCQFEGAECARCCWREAAAAFCMLVDAGVLWGLLLQMLMPRARAEHMVLPRRSATCTSWASACMGRSAATSTRGCRRRRRRRRASRRPSRASSATPTRSSTLSTRVRAPVLRLI